jgi:hypothetical protein
MLLIMILIFEQALVAQRIMSTIMIRSMTICRPTIGTVKSHYRSFSSPSEFFMSLATD